MFSPSQVDNYGRDMVKGLGRTGVVLHCETVLGGAVVLEFTIPRSKLTTVCGITRLDRTRPGLCDCEVAQ